ncbi:FcoT family thioesterase [Micromonospora sp. NBC_01813]|uniref:FcoT family thioesterase n=1 Tax=Micromonospora sp. NBC_01813 TaxID=2975988 RepID=UPI002DDB3AFF|nr:FcoT family thioesterase [Micromonospora sp. NBC_01813]WSA10799.1 FcoT family thioesterase [Micromonospora sp. NBC_01813]
MSTAVAEDLLTEVLSCYKPHCRYLLSASVHGRRTEGRLAIPESCYIDDTGHLNAVEVSICYNQLLYTALGAAVRDRTEPALAHWTLDDYWRRRLPDVLIVKSTNEFRRPLDPRSFVGQLTIERVIARTLWVDREPLISIDTGFRFTDAGRGLAVGTARVAIAPRATG